MGAWIGFSAIVTGMAFAHTFFSAGKIFFDIGCYIAMMGVLLIFYTYSRDEFLPKWMNIIIYHPLQWDNE
ncbi:MAG: hypothetical protein KAS78_03895 [Candidatus Pacebacteria bacterium]|nr:hypothetical protein [Candidatus Paceibacterota bacterium]